jgi:hypothetical protein
MMRTFHKGGLELGTYLPLQDQGATGECRFIHQDQYFYRIPVICECEGFAVNHKRVYRL